MVHQMGLSKCSPYDIFKACVKGTSFEVVVNESCQVLCQVIPKRLKKGGYICSVLFVYVHAIIKYSYVTGFFLSNKNHYHSRNFILLFCNKLNFKTRLVIDPTCDNVHIRPLDT